MCGMPADITDPAGAGALPTLRTARLAIRPLTLADAAFIVALLNDPGWLRYIGDKAVRNQDDARRYLASGPLAMYARHGIGLCAVARLADGATLGMCGLIRREGFGDVDIGFAFLPEGRGQGLAVESARAVLEHGFTALGLERIVAIVDPDNAASQRVLSAIGMRREGTTRLPNDDLELALWSVSEADR